MDPEKKELIGSQEQYEQLDFNKALLVVGKMGHGKSSFIRMLFQERNDTSQYISQNTHPENSPFIQQGPKNGTSQCHLYLAHPSHNLLPQNRPLYIIDSPGLDCDKSASLITQKVDDIILQKKLQIIGIAYVINIKERQVGRTGLSYFGQLIQLLKIKMKYKLDIVFCVCSKWDSIYDEEQGIINYLKDLKQVLKKNGCQSASKKLVRWVSKPIMDFRKYLRFIHDQEGGGNRIVSNQWLQLRKILHQQVDKACPYAQYQEDYQKYWKNIMEQIMKLFDKGDKKKAFQKVQAIFPVHITKTKKLIKKKNIIFPIVTTGTINISRFSLAFAIPPLALTGPVGITILVASVIIGMGLTAYQIRNQIRKSYSFSSDTFKLKKQDSKAEQLKKSLQQLIKSRILNNLCDEMLLNLKKDEQYINLPDLYWLSQSVRAYYGTQIKQQSEPFAIANKIEPKIKYQMIEGQSQVFILLRTHVWMPTFNSVQEIMKAQKQKIYK